MEYMELLNKIIEAEQLAQQIASEAKAKRDRLPDDLRTQWEELHAKYLERAERRVEAVAAQESVLADEQIGQLDAALSADLAQVDAFFREHREEMTGRLFQLVIGQC
jgi:DNA anti-recombination protein RmuC